MMLPFLDLEVVEHLLEVVVLRVDDPVDLGPHLAGEGGFRVHLELLDDTRLHLDLLVHLVELLGDLQMHLLDGVNRVRVPKVPLAHGSSRGVWAHSLK